LPLLWFRRKKQKEAEAAAEAAPEPEETEQRKTEAAAKAPPEADEAGAPKKRRRRGTRGGRKRREAKERREAREAEAAAPPQRKRAPAAERKRAPAAERKRAPAAERREPAAERKREPAAERKREPAEQRRTSTDGRRPAARRRTATRRVALPAAKRDLLVSVGVGEKRVAVLEDERVAEVYLERPESRSIAGNIYLGTVDNVLPGMEAAFVEIGLEKNGFLYVDEIVLPELEGRRHGRKIQDLIKRGQSVLVQVVKDPMKTKGARLTTEISLPGRFVVYVPSGEGLGVSRRLDDDERTRLRAILKEIAPKEGQLIVRTAAEGASAEDIERDLDFLQRLWKAIKERAESTQKPALVYQEAELPLRVIRDLFTEDFERALIDDELTYKRIVGYLKKTSPHMAERVSRYRQKQHLFEAYGVEEELRSTLSRRVELPSGGYLVFDYAEAFTVIDVNTGRFVGSRSRSSATNLEDTITKNNIEAVSEVVRQLRLRDIGGIIVIDFIDMANPKNRATVEEALRNELERDRTKTYVVEISPLGLVEMTRQNVTEGPREVLTKKCPTCSGDGIVVSETTAAVEAERRLRALVRGSRSKAFQIELHAHVAEHLIGPGAKRLQELEATVNRRLVLEGREDVPLDHLVVSAHGTVEKIVPESPIPEGSELTVKLVEVGRHDLSAGVGAHKGLAVTVADAAKLVGKRARVRIERVLNGSAYATLVEPAEKELLAPITAESQAEKPTRTRTPRTTRTRKAEAPAPAQEPQEVDTDEAPLPEDEHPAAGQPVSASAPAEAAVETREAGAAKESAQRKKTRRGTRGGRGRKRKPAAAAAPSDGAEAQAEAPARIHLPASDLGREAAAVEESGANGDEPVKPAAKRPVRASGPVEGAGENREAPPAEGAGGEEESAPRKRKTRRGSRGGRGRKRKSTTTTTTD
jgi:ribonuclease G